MVHMPVLRYTSTDASVSIHFFTLDHFPILEDRGDLCGGV